MKIVFPILWFNIGGGSYFVYKLTNALLNRGHDVEIVTPEGTPIAWPVRAKINRVPQLTHSTIPRADVIIPSHWDTVMPSWESNKGRVVRLSLAYEPSWINEVEDARLTYQIGAPIISLSQWQRQLILNGTGCESTVVGAGVDKKIFHQSEKLSTHTGRKTIFHIARAPGYYWKGSPDFWEACNRLQQILPKFDVITVTPEGVPSTSSFPHTVISAPTDLEMARLYSQADLYVSTSYLEALPLPQLEAMACATAVVTTDSGGTRDYAQNDINCLVVPPGDIDELTSAMFRLLSDDQKRQELALAGLNHVQSLTWDRVAEKVEAIIS